MGTYYYLDDPTSEFGTTPVFEDDYIAAIFQIAKRSGIKITDEMILKEIFSLNKDKQTKIKKGGKRK